MTCCCDPCCLDASLLFGPGRTDQVTTIVVDRKPVEIVAYDLGPEDCIRIERTDEECGVGVANELCNCLTSCRTSVILTASGTYRLTLDGNPPPAPDAVFVRATSLTGDVLTARLQELAGLGASDVSYGMLAILQDVTLFQQLVNMIVADPAARCVLARGLMSKDAFNSLQIGSDCGLYENDGTP